VTILYTTVVAGTTITASWGNNVRDGLVSGFASASARASAITSPIAGMLTYRADLGTAGGYEGYTGSAWAPAGAQLIQASSAGGASTFDFTTIPGVYGSLLVVGLGSLTGSGGAVDCTLKINSDTGAHYTYTSIDASQAGTTPAGSFANAQTVDSWAFGYPATTSFNSSRAGAFYMLIPGYANTTFPKIGLTQNFIADGGAAWNVKGRYWHWSQTAAITDLLFTSGAGNFAAGSYFALYGLP
jgi:hypothetical protein